MSDHARKVLKTCSTCGEIFTTVRELVIHEMQHQKLNIDHRPSNSSTNQLASPSSTVSRQSVTSGHSTSIIQPSTSNGTLAQIDRTRIFDPMRDTSKDERISCEYCYGSLQIRSLYLHHRVCHFVDTGSPLYYCSECYGGKGYGPLNRNYYRNRDDFLRHMKVHEETDARGPPTAYSMDDSLTRLTDGSMVTRQEIMDRLFIQTEATKERRADGTYLCEYCFREYRHLESMMRHIESSHRHNHEYRYYCGYCGRNKFGVMYFESDAEFRKHMIEIHRMTMKTIEEIARSGMTKLIRADVFSSIVGDSDFASGSSHSYDDGESTSEATIGVSVKREIDHDSTEYGGECSKGALNGSSTSKRGRLDRHSTSELRLVKQEPIDELESTISAVPNRQPSLELRSIKDEPIEDAELENGGSQASSAFYVVVKSDESDEI